MRASDACFIQDRLSDILQFKDIYKCLFKDIKTQALKKRHISARCGLDILQFLPSQYLYFCTSKSK